MISRKKSKQLSKSSVTPLPKNVKHRSLDPRKGVIKLDKSGDKICGFRNHKYKLQDVWINSITGVLMLDAKCIVCKDYIATSVAYLEANPDLCLPTHRIKVLLDKKWFAELSTEVANITFDPMA